VKYVEIFSDDDDSDWTSHWFYPPLS
jgi:hypothetical protein